jgi:hypothetical protein
MAPKSEDLYPEILFVSSENDRGDAFFLAHKTPDEVAMANNLKPTRAWIYKRERPVVVSGFSRVEEQDDAEV